MNEIIQYDFIDEFIAGDAVRVGKYGFPQLSDNYNVDSPGKEKTLPFNYMLSDKRIISHWFHFFINDGQFERIWKNFWHYIPYFQKAKGLISSDFSLYTDFSQELCIWNCLRNRSIAYALQKVNKNVIPTASFAGEETWDWCFDGLPHNSTVAITTNNVLSDPEAIRVFTGGFKAMMESINPKEVVICGNYPSWIQEKYPYLKITQIMTYGQVWKQRILNAKSAITKYQFFSVQNMIQQLNRKFI